MAQRLTGRAERDAIGSPINRILLIVHETSRLKVDNPIEKALAQGVAVGLANHTNLISKSGQEVPIDDSAAPLKDETGKLIGAVLVFRDIWVRRAAEKRLRAANAEIQRFVGAAAHDLSAPLNPVNAIS
jgi:PAS domain S-box-containing protein